MSSKQTIVICPGAWQSPAVWDDFSSQLREAGYDVEYVKMPTIGGTTTPLAGLSDDVKAVREVLTKLKSEGKSSPLMLCHSSGGVVGSNAVEGFDVAGMIYMAAFMIPKDQSLLGMLGGQPLPWMNVQEDRVTGVPEMMNQVAFNDMPAEAQEKWGKEMSHTAAALFATPSGFEPWSNGVPCAYIYCTLDNALPMQYQSGMSQQLGPDPVTATIESGHCPNLSQPAKLLEAIQTVEKGLKNKTS